MPRVFWGNFGFEHELSGCASLAAECTAGIEAELATVWLAIAEPGDVILSPGLEPLDDLTSLGGGRVPAHPGPDWQLVPWGWTAAAVKAAKRHGLQHDSPPLDVVREVNSRAFRLSLEQEWGVAPPGSGLVTNLSELEPAVAGSAATGHRAGWVLKASWGMAARERMVGRGTAIPFNIANWAARRLTEDRAIVAEPWLDRVEESGLQFDVPRGGDCRLLGVTHLLTNPLGGYVGSRIGLPAEELSVWEPAVEIGLRVATRLQSRGYFGPLGIDALRYRDADGSVRLRPLMDLNARWTMGRLSLGWRRLLNPGECATWLHGWSFVADAASVGRMAVSRPETSLSNETIPVAARDPSSAQEAGGSADRRWQRRPRGENDSDTDAFDAWRIVAAQLPSDCRLLARTPAQIPDGELVQRWSAVVTAPDLPRLTQAEEIVQTAMRSHLRRRG